jgi:hypothetical protein
METCRQIESVVVELLIELSNRVRIEVFSVSARIIIVTR